MNFANKQVKNVFSDIGAVVVYELSQGKRDYTTIVKEGGLYAGSKYVYDLVKPTVESAVRSMADSVFGRFADLIIEIVTSSAIFYAINMYIMKKPVDFVNTIWFFTITSPMADKLEAVLG